MLWLLRRLVPPRYRLAYHLALAWMAGLWYGRPARHLAIVAVTGTSGKSTVVWITAHMLEDLGAKAGRISTIDFSDGARVRINDLKMTMPGRFFLQRQMRRMVKNDCQVAVVEASSEGIAQKRNLGLEPDVAVLTNLSPEHLEAHGSFEKYQAAKEHLFAQLGSSSRKRGIKKAIVVNGDDSRAGDFLRYAADLKIAVTRENSESAGALQLKLSQLKLKQDEGLSGVLGFQGQRAAFVSLLIGRHNAENIALSAAAVLCLGYPLEKVAQAIASVPPPPGRLEMITVPGRTVIVDYAFHERALEALYDAISDIKHRKVIHVLGGTGGGRDRWRRTVIGKFAGQHADLVIVTNEDPYDEDPLAIALAVMAGAKTAGKMEGTDLHLILDRRLAIRRAIELAQSGDLVLVTGKASEQWIMGAHGAKIPWDDRQVVREELSRHGYGQGLS